MLQENWTKQMQTVQEMHTEKQRKLYKKITEEGAQKHAVQALEAEKA